MLTKDEQKIIDNAIQIIESKSNNNDFVINSPDAVKQFCVLQLAMSENEKFGVLFLDNQHRLIEFSIMFTGTVDSATIYPREVAKKALALNSSAIVITHNHPSGLLTPSNADKQITTKLFDGLKLLDIRVLDHIIVSQQGSLSFAERGLI
jgi:DNA repair protein RadC